MSGRRFHPWAVVRKSVARVRATLVRGDPLDLKAVNVDFVKSLTAQMPREQAMELAIGSSFEHVGAIEAALVRRFGLHKDGFVIDVGCGSGRLAKPLAVWLDGRYVGIDLVPDLVSHARRIANRPDWRFEVIDHIGIPEDDGAADLVCFFSVLTHLLHEQSYWYLEEARRVLKPGGRILASFLEFAEPAHLTYFEASLQAAKRRSRAPINVFIERPVLALWAERLGLELEGFHDAGEAVVGEGALGQALCVLRKP